ncbi:MAG TPA: hypothetical protein VGL09_22085 [Methylomirabilota bacterium]|jgi:hypothetical protein
MLIEFRALIVMALAATIVVAALVAVAVPKIAAAVRAARAERTSALHAHPIDHPARGLLTAEADRFIRSRQAAWRLRC